MTTTMQDLGAAEYDAWFVSQFGDRFVDLSPWAMGFKAWKAAKDSEPNAEAAAQNVAQAARPNQPQTAPVDTTQAQDAARPGSLEELRDMLRAELERAKPTVTAAVEQDAARYRWLRDADRSDPVIPYDELLCYAGESLDAAIDAAMEAKHE